MARTPRASSARSRSATTLGVGAPPRARQRDRRSGHRATRAGRHHRPPGRRAHRLLDVVGDQHDRPRLGLQARWPSQPCISARVIASSDANGSSSASTGLPASSERRNETRWRIPPDSSAGRVVLEAGQPEALEPRARACSRAPIAPDAARAQRQRRVVERAQPRQQQVALGHQRRRRAIRRRPRRAAAGRRSARAASSCRSRSDRRRRRSRRGAARNDMPSSACTGPRGRRTSGSRPRPGRRRVAVKLARLLWREPRSLLVSLPPRALPHRFEGSAPGRVIARGAISAGFPASPPGFSDAGGDATACGRTGCCERLHRAAGDCAKIAALWGRLAVSVGRARGRDPPPGRRRSRSRRHALGAASVQAADRVRDGIPAAARHAPEITSGAQLAGRLSRRHGDAQRHHPHDLLGAERLPLRRLAGAAARSATRPLIQAVSSPTSRTTRARTQHVLDADPVRRRQRSREHVTSVLQRGSRHDQLRPTRTRRRADQCASPAGVATCVTDLQLQQEIDKLITATRPRSGRGLPNIWFVFLPPDVDTARTPGQCATNGVRRLPLGVSTVGHGPTVYAPVPDPLVEFTPPPGLRPGGQPGGRVDARHGRARDRSRRSPTRGHRVDGSRTGSRSPTSARPARAGDAARLRARTARRTTS